MKTTVQLSTRLVNQLTVSPAKFKQLLLTKKSSRDVATISGVSVRTVQQYRKTIEDNYLFSFSTTTY